MNWTYRIANLIFVVWTTLILGVLSSLLATVIHDHRETIVSMFEAILLNARRTHFAINLKSKQVLDTLKIRSRRAVGTLWLKTQVVVTSRESIVLGVFGLVSILLVTCMLAFVSHFNNDFRSSALTPGSGKWTYRVSNGEEGWDMKLQLQREGVEVFSTNVRFATLVTFEADGTSSEISLNEPHMAGLESKDISGDHVPDIMLIEECGCSSGFVEHLLLSLDREITKTFSTTSRRRWNFEDRDNDRLPEIITHEVIVSDSGFDVDERGSVEVILKFDNGKLYLASKLMKRPPPSEQQFHVKVITDRKENQEPQPKPDDSYIAQLVFSGNGELARQYVRYVMSDQAVDDQELYWLAIYEDMMGSDYWEAVASLNNWTVDQYEIKDCGY